MDRAATVVIAVCTVTLVRAMTAVRAVIALVVASLPRVDAVDRSSVTGAHSSTPIR